MSATRAVIDFEITKVSCINETARIPEHRCRTLPQLTDGMTDGIPWHFAAFGPLPRFKPSPI